MEHEINVIGIDGIKTFKWDKLVKLFIAFRWVFNTAFIGFPWLVWSSLMVIYNIVFNAWINKWWAKGNFWLLANTYFSIFQCIASWPVFFEVGIYLRHFAFVRWFSLFSAITYNVVYLGLLGGWLIQTYMLPEEEYDNVGTIDILMNMFFILFGGEMDDSLLCCSRK